MADKNCYDIKNISFSIDETEIIKDLSTNIRKGEITTIIGPNGCGKSTLLQILTKMYKGNKGEILIGDTPIELIKMKDFAKMVAIVNQYNTSPEDITVRRLVGYGRIPYKNISISHMNQEDEEKINWALDITGTKELENQIITGLSGGQKQRVWIAMALAQDTDILFLDEPTTYLDIKYQKEILEIVKNLNENHKISIVMVLHDINQGIKYSHNIIAMKDGKVYCQGDAKSIITRDLIRNIYDIDVEMFKIDDIEYVIAF